MKTVVKIDPKKEYLSAKKALEVIAGDVSSSVQVNSLDDSLDNLNTVINVLIERLTPKKRKKPKKISNRRKENLSPRSNFEKLPSEKFPELEVEENIQTANETPKCPCCSEKMKESGLYKTSEKLEVIPKKYYIVRNKRVIYNCGSCNGALINTPAVPSISRNSNYGDSIIVDATLSKFCDLIPIERYCAMAARNGLKGLPPNSIIGVTHTYAEFLTPVYKKIMHSVLSSKLIRADETPHKMLEGDHTSNWYLWGFSTDKSCFFEAHNTRSGDIPLGFLLNSDANFLLTDGYSGYKKAIKSLAKKGKIILESYCNAHSIRYFKEASTTWTEEAEIFLKLYAEIYDLEKKAKSEEEKKLARKKMEALFIQLKIECQALKEKVMPKSLLEKAINYFLNHYDGLTRCLEYIQIPLDNNSSERLMRSPVVGRKTWYGTHSKRGARTSSIVFSIVESCKLNQINPRNYFEWINQQIHSKKEVLTPYEYSII